MNEIEKISDIDLSRWKDYGEIITDSLWIVEKRSKENGQSGWYWGNFIPQIPEQMMLRYTKKGDLVFDPFAGSGTTILAALKLGRDACGIEINPITAEKAKESISRVIKKVNDAPMTLIETGDSLKLDFKLLIERFGRKKADLMIIHPPYHDIIRFSNIEGDLSGSKTTDDFLKKMEIIGKKSYDSLNHGRYTALVIGDNYRNGKWIPLGFLTMERFLRAGYTLKSIVVKNYEQTRGKRNLENLWRYRAMAGGYYIFKHEYIFIFRKT
ncbi:DNA methyltransferase [Caldiplasma sukawensis]